MIVVKNLRVDVLTEPLFTEVSLVIRQGERLGLIPAKGTEVEVFLQTLAGVAEEDEGTITYEAERVVYVSPSDVVGGSEALAKVLHTRPTFLCINASTTTPETVATLKRFISSFRGGMILATDSAELLSLSKVTRILEIQPSTKLLTTFTGKYEDYLIEREKVQARIAEAYEKQQREKARLEGWLDKKREEVSGRPSEHGAVIRAKARYLKKEILDKEIPNPTDFV
jgi:ATPase subunit of ABC transporter with duplicated ATPase domains